MISESSSLELLRKKIKHIPNDLLILGSGWNGIIGSMAVELEIPYKELFGVDAGVPGHEGKLVVGKLAKKRVVCMAGRMHIYEGYSANEATMPIRVLHAAGVKRMVVTAAAGALNPKYQVGDIVVTSDLLTLFLASNPLRGPQFLDMSEPFDVEMRATATKVLVEQELSFWEGVYAYMPGPHFETYADKKALMQLGADVVGMSTVPETLMARWLKMSVLSLALVTNLAFVEHSHEEVVGAAKKQEHELAEFLTRLSEQL